MILDLIEFFLGMGSIGLALWVLVTVFLDLFRTARDEWSEMGFWIRVITIPVVIFLPVAVADGMLMVCNGLLEAEALGRFFWACSRAI